MRVEVVVEQFDAEGSGNTLRLGGNVDGAASKRPCSFTPVPVAEEASTLALGGKPVVETVGGSETEGGGRMVMELGRLSSTKVRWLEEEGKRGRRLDRGGKINFKDANGACEAKESGVVDDGAGRDIGEAVAGAMDCSRAGW